MPDFAAMPAALAPSATEASNAPTSVSLFDRGLIQVLEAAVSGLQPKQPYVLALAVRWYCDGCSHGIAKIPDRNRT
jgi:hypothetical protein